jgi:hypothetical protein
MHSLTQQNESQNKATTFSELEKIYRAELIENISINLFNKSKPNDYLIFSIINMCLFFPLWCLWLPALVCSLVARKRNKLGLKSSQCCAIGSLVFNLLCSFLGLIIYALLTFFFIIYNKEIINYFSKIK